MTSPYRITYTAGGGERVLPFVVGVVGDFTGHGQRAADDHARLIDIDVARFDTAMAALGPRLRLADDVDLTFANLDAFSVEHIRRTVPAHLSAVVAEHPDFVRMARAWRGLHDLVSIAATNPLVRIRLLDCSRQGLGHLLATADDVEDTSLFKHLFLEPHDDPDGEPYALLVVDIDITQQDIALVGQLGEIASRCFAPVLLPAAPSLLASLEAAPVGASDGAAFADWQALRETHGANFTVVVDDSTAGPYAVAGRLTSAFAHNEWAASFFAPTTDRTGDLRGAALASHGVLSVFRHDNRAVMASKMTLRRPAARDMPAAMAFERERSTLPPVLGGSRIMHYLLMQYAAATREAGPSSTIDLKTWHDRLEGRLNEWLRRYLVAGRPPGVPLHDGLVRFWQNREQPDHWSIVAHLIPSWEGGGELTASERFATRVRRG